MNESAKDAQKIVIAELEERVGRLRSELAQAEEALRAARLTQDLLEGRVQARASPMVRTQSLIAAAEEVLRERGEMHVRELAEVLRLKGFSNATGQTLSSALSRLNALGKRVVRTRPNKYAVRAEG
jgi:hypothetical protein